MTVRNIFPTMRNLSTVLSALLIAFTAQNAVLALTINRRQSQNNPACAVFPAIRDELLEFFENTCGSETRQGIRIAFHDAAPFSLSDPSVGGGADGSILTFPEEVTRIENADMSDVIDELREMADRFNISRADMVQFSGAVALSLCPGSPPVKFFAGRGPALIESQPLLVPSPFAEAPELVARFADMGFSLLDVIVLNGAHTVATQRAVDLERTGEALDSTVQNFDSQLFLDVLLKETPPNQFRFVSDASLARDPLTACTWINFLNKPQAELFNPLFTDAMTRLSLVGHDVNQLTDCSDVLPSSQAETRVPQFPGVADQLDPANRELLDLSADCDQLDLRFGY